MYQKTIFLNWDFDSYFLHSFSVAPNDFNFWLRLMDIALKCAFLDYCYVFHFLCYETCLSSHLHTVGLLHSHWNHSSPTLNSFNHQCCIVVTSTTTITFSKSLRVFFFFPFSLSPFGRTLEMMALCISPRWPRPTWPTTPVMPMATRNFFRPTLFKWMVRNCRKDGIQNHVSLHSKSIWTWSGALDKAFHDGALVSTVTFTIIQFLL